MSPTQFPYDPTKVKASMAIFPKGEYEVRIGEPKGFIRTAGKGTDKEHDSYGVRFPYKVMEGEYAGENGSHSIYHHSPEAGGMAKQFLMAVLGYGKGSAEEARFDKNHADADFSVNYETGEVGDFYKTLTGKRVLMSTEPQRDKTTGNESNNAKGWRPIPG